MKRICEDIKHHLTVAMVGARLSVQKQLEYPLFLVSFALMIPIQYITGVFILKVLVDKFQDLGGWNFAELLFLYGLGILSHALVVILFIPTWSIDDAVIDGEFDRYLVRPVNVFFHYCFYRVNIIGVIDLVPALIIFVTGCYLLGIGLSFSFGIQLILILVGATLIRAAIYLFLGTLAFWTKRTRPLITMALNVMDRTTQFPMNVYPYLLQVCLTYVIPIAFINFVPANYFLGKESYSDLPMSVVLWTPLIGGMTFFFAHGFFRLGLRHYESAGS